MWEVGLEVVEAYVLRKNNKVVGTGSARLGRVTGVITSRGGEVTRGGGRRVIDINSKLAREKN